MAKPAAVEALRSRWLLSLKETVDGNLGGGDMVVGR